MSGPAIFVYGPQGCGKTVNAQRIARHFGCHRVVDDWLPGDPIVPGALHLTYEYPMPTARRWYAFSDLPPELRRLPA